MKIVIISDTHNRHKHLISGAYPNLLPSGDLLLHCGDFSGYGKKHEVESFLKWLGEVSHNYTYGAVFIAGNHDRSFDPKYLTEYDDLDFWGGEQPENEKPKWLQNAINVLEVRHPVQYLENKATLINSFKIFGSPITPSFNKNRWAFNADRGPEIIGYWNLIPDDTDIIMTHGPVFGKLDYVPHSNEFVGCEDLRYTVKKIRPLLCVCGHIHEEGGKIDYDENTVYVNASICNHAYEPVNKPIVIKLDPETKKILEINHVLHL